MSTSLQVFRAHLRQLQDGTIDASEIHSEACFAAWLDSRGTTSTENEARKFQRSLSNHLGGVDGRSPFTAEEEAAILKVLRRKGQWPCFQATMKIGSMGYRSRGYHEKQTDAPRPPPPAATSAAASASSSSSSMPMPMPPPTALQQLSQYQLHQHQQQQQQQQQQQHQQLRQLQQLQRLPQLLPVPPNNLPSRSTTAYTVSPTFTADLAAFSNSIAKYSQAFSVIGVDVSASIYGLFSLFCEARLPFLGSRTIAPPQLPAYAQALCDHLSALHNASSAAAGTVEKEEEDRDPYLVTIYTLRHFGKRVLAQNAKAKLVMGDASGQSDNIPRMFMPSEWGRLTYALGLAYSNPGQEVAFPIRYSSGLVYDFKVWVDPQSFLHAAFGRLSANQPPPTPSPRIAPVT